VSTSTEGVWADNRSAIHRSKKRKIDFMETR
jgi:hypothetical protein